MRYLQDPMVACFAPSSKHIIDKVVKQIDFKTALSIIEYGAGDGVVTKEIVKRMRTDAALVAFEPNEDMFSELTSITDKRFTAINDVAQNSSLYIAAMNADLILASIPFSIIDDTPALLESISQRLKQSGKMIIFHQYNPLKLKNVLPQFFRSITMEFEPRNTIPSFIFVCEK